MNCLCLLIQQVTTKINSKLVAQSRGIGLLKKLSSTSTLSASGSSEPSPRTIVKDEDTTSADENVDGDMVRQYS